MLKKIIVVYTFFTAVLGCGPCEPRFCPQNPDECQLGVVPDPCGCCAVGVCVLKLSSRCLYGSVPISSSDFPRYSTCGDNAVCQLRNDLADEQIEATCQCVESGLVCGTDNNTYSDVCSMRAAAVSDVAHRGACAQPPRISAGPVSKTIQLGHNIALDCEAYGVPVPALTWQFRGNHGPTYVLPADDESVVVQTRGGPEASALTSWVQILDAGPQYSGAFICVAQNQHGIADSAAIITIKP